MRRKRSRLRRRLRKVKGIKRGLALSAVLLVGIMGYQYMAANQSLAEYAEYGNMVEVSGRQMHYSYVGDDEAEYTVVCESGLGLCAYDWKRVVNKVRADNKVFSYDRAGYGLSDRSKEERTSEVIAIELHELLEKVGAKPPYIMVGHSFGGMNVRAFESLYPDEVVGVVLVDAVSEHFLKGMRTTAEGLFAKIFKSPWSARVGLTRVIRKWLFLKSHPYFPRDTIKRHRAFAMESLSLWATPSCVATRNQEIYHFADDAAFLLESAKSMGNKPLIVIEAERWNKRYMRKNQTLAEMWHAMQEGNMKLSENSEYWVAKGSSHMVVWERPDIVVEAVARVKSKL